MELRLILILIGAVVVTGVYLYSRQRSTAAPTGPRRTAPTLGEADFPGDDLPSDETGGVGKPVPVREQGAQLILALHVMPRDAEGFAGTDVLSALELSGLRYGRHQVFHRLEKGGPEAASIFSVANLVEPGSFDLDALPEAQLPGLTLFMLLPGSRAGVAAYADMLATARRLAQHLSGEVLDENRSTLTRQTAHHIRERIIEFEHRPHLRQPV